MADTQIIPAREGRALRLARGEAVEIVNHTGTQVVDTFAFVADDLAEFMSMEHSRVENGRLLPRIGEPFFTNRRRPLLVLEEDTSPGIHDTLLAACDPPRYERLGCTAYHRNCADNLREAMAALGLDAPAIPAPLNLFMNIPIHPDQTLEAALPAGHPGERVVLRALHDCIVVMSACPQDMTPINGADRTPTEASFRHLPA